MRLLITICVTALAAAGSVQASQRMTNVQYVQTGRCAGLAAGGGQDATAFDTALRDNRSGRHGGTLASAQSARREAQREIRRADGETRERLAAELSQACAALVA